MTVFWGWIQFNTLGLHVSRRTEVEVVCTTASMATSMQKTINRITERHNTWNVITNRATENGLLLTKWSVNPGFDSLILLEKNKRLIRLTRTKRIIYQTNRICHYRVIWIYREVLSIKQAFALTKRTTPIWEPNLVLDNRDNGMEMFWSSLVAF